MNVQIVLFYVFAAILLSAALAVIIARNPVHAALWLVLAFFTAAAHWLMLRAEFLAIALVLVYVGAVMVLFLFVVMMLDVNFDSLRKRFRSYVPVAIIVGVLVFAEMALVLWSNPLDRRDRQCPAATWWQQHAGARRPPLHNLRLSVRDCRRRVARGDHRGNRAHSSPAQGNEVSGSGEAGEGPGTRPAAGALDARGEEGIGGQRRRHGVQPELIGPHSRKWLTE